MSYTVLLVDDEPNVLDGLQRALRKEPYLILTATSAEIALEILRTRAVESGGLGLRDAWYARDRVPGASAAGVS